MFLRSKFRNSPSSNAFSELRICEEWSALFDSLSRRSPSRWVGESGATKLGC